MNIPVAIEQWLQGKVQEQRWSGVLQSRSVTHHYFKALGGRNMEAGITVSIAPAATFQLSLPADLSSAPYIPAVRDGLFSVLLSQGLSPVLRCAVTYDS